MAVIGSLSVKLGLVTVEWDQATAKAKAQAKDLKKSIDELGGGIKTLSGYWKTLGGSMSIGAVGIGALLQQTLQFTDAISEMAKGFDLSIEKTLQFRKAVQVSGGNAEGASKILSSLFSKIEEARSGNEATIAQFEKLGISFEEISRMKPEQALNRVFEALSNIGNTYQRVKAVKELLGKQGIGLDLEQVSQRLNMTTAEFQSYARSIERVGQVNDQLAESLDNMKIAFADMIAPLVRDGVVSIEKFKAAMVAITAAAVVGGLVTIASTIGKIVVLLREGAKVQAAITAMTGGKGAAQLAAGALAYVVAKRQFDLDVESAIAETEDSDASDKQKEEEKNKVDLAARREIIAGQAKIALLKKQIDFAKEEGEIKIKALNMDKYSAQLIENNLTNAREIAAAQNERAQAMKKENLSQAEMNNIGEEYRQKVLLSDEKAIQNQQLILATREKEIKQINNQQMIAKSMQEFEVKRLELEQERAYMTDNEYKIAVENLSTRKRIAEIEQQIVDAKDKYGAGPSFDAEEKRLRDLIAIEQELNTVRLQSIALSEKQRTTFSEGWGEAFRKYAEDAQAYGKLGSDMFTSFTSNMGSAIDNFVRTGKMNFKSFAKSVIQDILAMMLKFQAMRLLTAGLGMFGMGSFMPKTGSITMSGMPGNIGFAAEGGDLTGPTIVGEKGPELLIPSRNTGNTVIPNNKMPQFGSTNVTNNYINAIDTKSFEERLLGSSNAIWAANAYANKTLAVNRGRA
jgi:lambda family phage tail tape measure protein